MNSENLGYLEQHNTMHDRQNGFRKQRLALNPKDSFKFDVISNDLIWLCHIVDLTMTAGKKLGFRFRVCKYLSDANLETL